MNTWTITLHAAEDSAMSDQRTRETVVAAAQALAERYGLEITDLLATEDSLTATLATEEATAVGFAAELRRSTNAWHRAKSNSPLWKSPPEEAP